MSRWGLIKENCTEIGLGKSLSVFEHHFQFRKSNLKQLKRKYGGE